ncbi:hypothetical protein LB505_014447 [Fusarium chuoi]|nr:hypothetical protein LB505_014447 [Fusarium chuoi]
MAEPDNPAVTNILEPEDQTAEDSCVDEAIDNASSTQSISSSILRYQVENGRRMNKRGWMLLNNSMGTGIWAMDVVDEHPKAEVLSMDLSLI